MPDLLERGLEGARFLRDAGAHPLTRMALRTGTLLLPRDAVNSRRTDQGQAERHRKTQRGNAESQTAEPGKSLLHLGTV